MMAAIMMSVLQAAIWSLATARGWLSLTWAIPALTILTQIAMCFLIDLGSVSGIIWFSISSTLVAILIGFAMVAVGFSKVER